MSNKMILFFSGGRDKRGGPILTFPARSNHDRIKQEDLRKLVTYLSTVPRLYNSNIYLLKCPWKISLKKSVLIKCLCDSPKQQKKRHACALASKILSKQLKLFSAPNTLS